MFVSLAAGEESVRMGGFAAGAGIANSKNSLLGAEETIDKQGVKIGSAAFLDYSEALIKRERIAVNALFGNSIEYISNCNNSRCKGDFLAGESVGVTLAVPFFVVADCEGECHLAELGCSEVGEGLFDNVAAGDGVGFHSLIFISGEFAGLLKNGVGNRYLADIVHRGCGDEVGNIVVGENFGISSAAAQLFCNNANIHAGALDVLACAAVAVFDKVGECGDSFVIMLHELPEIGGVEIYEKGENNDCDTDARHKEFGQEKLNNAGNNKDEEEGHHTDSLVSLKMLPMLCNDNGDKDNIDNYENVADVDRNADRVVNILADDKRHLRLENDYENSADTIGDVEKNFEYFLIGKRTAKAQHIKAEYVDKGYKRNIEYAVEHSIDCKRHSIKVVGGYCGDCIEDKKNTCEKDEFGEKAAFGDDIVDMAIAVECKCQISNYYEAEYLHLDKIHIIPSFAKFAHDATIAL